MKKLNSQKQGTKIAIIVAALILIGILGYSLWSTVLHHLSPSATLQATITVVPQKMENGQENRILPETNVKLIAKIENIGKIANAPVMVYIRYTNPKVQDPALHPIFSTETLALPSIIPGQTYTLAFSRSHEWPSLVDFILNNWEKNEYQAVVITDNHEEVIGNLPIFVSASFFPGETQKRPRTVPPVKEKKDDKRIIDRK